MLEVLYAALIVIELLMMGYLIFRFKSRISPFYICMFGCTMISSMGYMLIYNASNLESAVFANEITYFGASFSSFFMFLCIADLCKVKVHKAIIIFAAVLSSFVLLCSSSYGVSDLYYKELVLVSEGPFNYLQKTYGPLHMIYPIYLGISVVGCLVIALGSMRRKKDVSYKNSIALIIVLILIIITYASERILHLRFELVPIALCVNKVVVLIILNRISLYDIPSIASDMRTEKQTGGLAIFDEKGRYLASDEVAKIWFPELGECKVDYALSKWDTDFLQTIKLWLEGKKSKEVFYFERDGKIISATHTIMDHGFSRDTHCISLQDDTKQQEYTKLVEKYNEDLEKEVEKKTDRIRHIQDDITISMASIVENRDNNTGGHIKRTSDVIRIFAQHLRECVDVPEMTKEMKRYVTKAAPLHDFGKIAVPDRILNKPGRFEPDEYEIMKTHAAKGAVIVERILQNSDDKAFKKVAVNVAHYHHEKWDGTGYPEGLSGKQIPFEARVMALADVFDALVSKRVYKDSFSYDKAFQIIEESSGTHFDPELCKEFLHAKNDLIHLYDSYND